MIKYPHHFNSGPGNRSFARQLMNMHGRPFKPKKIKQKHTPSLIRFLRNRKKAESETP